MCYYYYYDSFFFTYLKDLYVYCSSQAPTPNSVI